MSTHTWHKCTRGRGARQHTSAYVSIRQRMAPGAGGWTRGRGTRKRLVEAARGAAAARRAQPVRQCASSFSVSEVSCFSVSASAASVSVCRASAASAGSVSAAFASVLFNTLKLLQCQCLLHHTRHTHALKAATCRAAIATCRAARHVTQRGARSRSQL